MRARRIYEQQGEQTFAVVCDQGDEVIDGLLRFEGTAVDGCGHSPERGQGKGLCPHSPTIAFGPVKPRPFTTMLPPVPVPIITPNTTSSELDVNRISH